MNQCLYSAYLGKERTAVTVKHSREIEHEEKVMIYAKNRYLNKVIYGTDQHLMEDENRNLRVRTCADFSNCYMVVTGIKRNALNLIDRGQYRYFDLSPVMDETVHRVLKQNGYTGDYIYIDPSQEICVLYSPRDQTARIGEPLETAGQIQRELAQILKTVLPQERGCCFSVYAGHIAGYKDIEKAYSVATRLHDLCFFDMKPQVITIETIERRKKAVSYAQVMEVTKQLENMLENGWSEEALLHDFFFNQLAQTYDFRLFDDALLEMKHLFWEFSNAYNMESEFEWEKWERSGYLNIQEVYAFVVKNWRKLHAQIQSGSIRVSYITRNAMLFIKNHFRQSPSVCDVAEYVHVSPSHLSHVFNRETQRSIPTFVLECRMRETVRLLENTDLKTGEIAEKIGIENVSYFLRVFKKTYGTTPQEYRQMYEKNR